MSDSRVPTLPEPLVLKVAKALYADKTKGPEIHAFLIRWAAWGDLPQSALDDLYSQARAAIDVVRSDALANPVLRD